MVEWVKWELLGVGGTAATATSKTSTNRSSKHYPVPCHQFDLIVGTAFSTAPLPSTPLSSVPPANLPSTSSTLRQLTR